MFKLKSTTKVALIGVLTTLTIFSQIKADLRHSNYSQIRLNNLLACSSIISAHWQQI